MEQKKYNEFKVSMDGKKIVEKMPTLRKTVMIYDHEAKRMNKVSGQTKFYYELTEIKKSELPKEDADGEKAELWEAVDILVAGGKIKKPHHATGIDKLKTIIEENK